jgi:archaellum component FlaC
MIARPDDKNLSEAQKFWIREYVDSIESRKDERRMMLVGKWSAILGVTGLAVLTGAWAFIQNQAVTSASSIARDVAGDLAQKATVELDKALADKAGDIEKKRTEAYDAIIKSRVTAETNDAQAADNLRRSGDLRKKLEESLTLLDETDVKSKEARNALAEAQSKVQDLAIQVTENLQKSNTLKRELSESSAFTEEVRRQVGSIEKIYKAVGSLNDAKQDIVAQIKSDPEFRIKIAGNDVLPAGLVAAFDRSQDLGACPNGWKLFEQAKARVIVGAGANANKDMNGSGLTNYPALRDDPANAVGGEEIHRLTVAELPPHSIETSGLASVSRVDRYNAGGRDYPVVTVRTGAIDAGGAGEPIRIMPPFIALYYCIKE